MILQGPFLHPYAFYDHQSTHVEIALKNLGAVRDIREQNRIELEHIEPGVELHKLKSQFPLLVNDVISR